MTKKFGTKRVIVVLKFPVNVAQLIIYCRGILTDLTGNINVPLPYPANTPTQATVKADIDALEAAEALALNKAVGNAAGRDIKLEVVKRDMRGLRAMVQIIADNNTPVNAVAIVESTGMSVKKPGTRKPTVFNVKNTLVSGMVKLGAPANKGSRGAHQWYYTTDLVNFTNPVFLPATSPAKTQVGGLVAGTKHAFFHIAVVSGSENVVDGPIFLMVI
jgi:hypothetical protein